MEDKLNEISMENYVILIYFILLFVYLYANKIEVNYIYYKEESDKKIYRLLVFIVFLISLIISIIFAIFNIKDLYEYEESMEIYNLKKLSAFASILIVIATGIYLYIVYMDEDINLEVNP